MEQNCGTCRFFHRYQDDKPMGCCHAGHPTAIMVGLNPPFLAGQRPQPVVDAFWPPTHDGEWCGDHQTGEFPRKPVVLKPIATADQVTAVLADLDTEGSA